MNEARRARWLRVALCVFAALFVFGVYPLTVLWPSGWCWHPGQSEYLQMIIGLYATLGVCLALAARETERHVALIAFTLWSSIVHATIMAVQSFNDPRYMGHLVGDVPALYIVAGVLGWLCPAALRLRLSPAAADLSSPGRAVQRARPGSIPH